MKPSTRSPSTIAHVHLPPYIAEHAAVTLRRSFARIPQAIGVLVLAFGTALAALAVHVFHGGGPWMLIPKFGYRAPIPAYGLELSNPSAPAFPRTHHIKLSPDQTLSILVRPAESVNEPIVARAFVRESGGLRPWAIHLKETAEGVFFLRSAVRELPMLGIGRWPIVVLVGRPRTLPADPEEARDRSRTGDWQALEGEIEVVPPG